VGATALCPGTFDPVTNGHLDIIERAAQHFDRVVVAVLDNPGKRPLFAVDERVAMLEETTAHLDGVEVDSFSGLLVEYAERIGANAIVKGLRAVSDFEYEIQMAQMNRRLSGVETFFISTTPTWSYLSSSLVREVAGLGGDVSSLVPPPVVDRLRERVTPIGGRA
jgi:pantetheine-phosphate adenylyltransferase